MSDSHQHLYDMDRQLLFAQFVGAVQKIRVDGGPLCASYEAPSLIRMARAVEARVDPGNPREAKLGGVATVLRVLLSRANGLDEGEDQSHLQPLPELVEYFAELRTDLGVWLPPTSSVSSVPDEPTGGLIESLRDGPNPDGQPGVSYDVYGRPWIEPDPADEVWSDEQVAAMPHCVGCHEPMVSGADHSGCRQPPELLG